MVISLETKQAFLEALNLCNMEGIYVSGNCLKINSLVLNTAIQFFEAYFSQNIIKLKLPRISPNEMGNLVVVWQSISKDKAMIIIRENNFQCSFRINNNWKHYPSMDCVKEIPQYIFDEINLLLKE